ncbi:hypothetical protein E0K83_03945 [Gramella sp. BOM4]|nr:hypothetical protein [Christiangramia bathymodioli]
MNFAKTALHEFVGRFFIYLDMSKAKKYIDEIVSHGEKYGFNSYDNFAVPENLIEEVKSALKEKGLSSVVLSEWKGLCQLFVADGDVWSYSNLPIESSIISPEKINSLKTTKRAESPIKVYPQINRKRLIEWLDDMENYNNNFSIMKMNPSSISKDAKPDLPLVFVTAQQLEYEYRNLPHGFIPRKIMINPLNTVKFKTFRGIPIEFSDAIKFNHFLFV